MLSAETTKTIANRLIDAADGQLNHKQIETSRYLTNVECDFDSEILSLLNLSSCGYWKIPERLFQDVESWGNHMVSDSMITYKQAAERALVINRGYGLPANQKIRHN